MVFIASFKALKKKLTEAIESLPEKEKLIISLYYYDELSLKEIGKVLDINITESRVCQIESKIILKLKSELIKTGIYKSAIMS